MSGCRVCGFSLRLPVARLAASDVGLYDDARFPGRMLVSAHEHFEHLDEMVPDDLGLFMADVAQTSRALRSPDGVERVNVAILGNRESHVHAHVIPRRAGEPNAGRAPWDGSEPWAPLSPTLLIALTKKFRELLTI